MNSIGRIAIGLLLGAGTLLAAPAPPGELPLAGTWRLNNWTPGESIMITLERRAGNRRWEWGTGLPLSDLHGLTRGQLRATHETVSFSLDRDAGSFGFTGTMRLGIGRGEFRFEPHREFARALADLDITATDDEALLTLALHDLSLDYATEVKKLGLGSVTALDLIAFSDHGVSIDLIRSLAAVGTPGLSVTDVIRLQEHGIDGRYLSELAAAGGRNLSVEQIVRLYEHGVD